MNERMELALGRLAGIPDERIVPEPYGDYFRRVAMFLLSVRKDADNAELYRDILPENYGESYANPDYAVKMLGSPMGQLLSAVYAELRGIIPCVFEDDEEGVCVLLELFLEIYGDFSGDELPSPEGVKLHFRSYLEDYMPAYIADRIRRQVDPEMSFAADIIKNADLSNTDYLYRFGEYVSEDTVASAAYLITLPEEKVRSMANAFTEGYRLGFEHAGKTLQGKKTVQIVYELGFERMIRCALENFEQMGLAATFVRAPYRLVTKTQNRKNGYTGAIPNMQFDYDHRDDLGLVLDDEYATHRLRSLREGYEEVKALAGAHAGPAVLETFGEEPFTPAACENRIQMTDAQQAKSVRMRNEGIQITQRYIREEERSFTIISFPVPAIGKDFREIFDEVIRINTLDNRVYGDIQQALIDALDKGYAARIKGKGANATDLIVRFHPLSDGEKETAFENCVADVNIPVGEVFTSPQLMGTNGVLFVSRVFLNGYEFMDLSITIKDGMVSDYSCGNFGDRQEGRRYIEDNILFHHPSLPMGEFAIGTNTAAYVMGRKYNIEARLPILIAEKTGPHFAFGDTCYSWEEDNPVYNPDGKEIIARDNSISLLRKTDPGKAYFGCHTDITIPYEELGSICVLTAGGGEIPIIEDGRFVLPGTEALNGPLDYVG
ncbi:MAG: aminopeptidase [Lachnospiraceae bacterium]|nr:aminopeptidase [Lachnospiraceae bacterium]